MIRILHMADLHLDSPFQGLDRERAIARREEQRQLLRRMGSLVTERQADILLLAGDLFDSNSAYPETARLLGEVLSGLSVPVFIAPGNHDRYAPRSAWDTISFGENVHVFKSGAMEAVEVPELNLRVWGTAFTDRYREPPLANFTAPVRDGRQEIMVLHGEVGNSASSYGAISVQDLARSGMDYVALGHVHEASGLRKTGNTFYAWPGCPEGRGFDELGQKGVYLVELDGSDCRAEFIPLEGRRYEIFEVDITNETDISAALERAVPADTERDIYRIRLTGETEEAPDAAALLRALSSRFYVLELRDETRPRRDIWAGQGEDNLKGLFLARMQARLASATDDEERETITQAVRLGLRAMEKGDELPL